MEKQKKSWFKEHIDSAAIIGTILTVSFWMSSEFKQIHKDISDLRTDMAVVKAVLILKNIMPADLAMKVEKLEDK